MIKIENTNVVGLEPSIRGMRNPMNSWEKSDSGYCCDDCENFGSCTVMADCAFQVGHNDHELMLQLATGGSVHAKYRRMIVVYVDITAPLYWWKEFDTYKVGTVANSCSTMHKIHAKEFVREDFSYDHLIGDRGLCWSEGMIAGPECNNSPMDVLDIIIDALNIYRQKYLTAVKTEEYTGLPAKDIWWQMIQLLPSSYNQKRTVMLNYEVLAGIYQHRRNHKLDEWREVCRWIESLPYSELITCNTIEKDKSNALTSAIAKLKAELKWNDDQIAEFLLEQAKLYTGEKTVDVTHLFNPN